MNTEIAFTKKCYRCDNLVRLKSNERLELAEEFTCCDVCCAKLNVEAGFAGVAHPDFVDWKNREAEVLDALLDGHPNPEGYMEMWYEQNPCPTHFPKDQATISTPPPAVSVT